ncbi:hypothetical protein TREMEDRAFT_63292 [Tremella mesenterica DSM 1558]|uniref:uncharacterized protein n=1 Tax=Tremella mesenterica (strain ATCC 24925 / CBS 8224 / DSM 1558 / NBRC 9311 / NRRL Y-6157 / RJB 2259-6 / UBC 559-6) TaxID=578456 RepID=UPI0003F4A24E|nr:uncharacterized protein TREMEDRAFT_63292 [Tremella mesenterica DSM 1558]EIW68827.1 hypothetical protein TREMEDRAFT_63292 [Tremella mesenterica DSM 1558]
MYHPSAPGGQGQGWGEGYMSVTGKQPNFLQKLYEFLSLEPHPCPDVIYWASDSKQLVIANPDRLVKEVLPKLFKHDKLSSFGRQLNIYGFSRLFPGRQFKDGEGNVSDASVWAHPSLHRLSTPGEIATIKRRAAPKLFRTRRLANGQLVRSRAGPAVEAKFREVRESIAESKRHKPTINISSSISNSSNSEIHSPIEDGQSPFSPTTSYSSYHEGMKLLPFSPNMSVPLEINPDEGMNRRMDMEGEMGMEGEMELEGFSPITDYHNISTGLFSSSTSTTPPPQNSWEDRRNSDEMELENHYWNSSSLPGWGAGIPNSNSTSTGNFGITTNGISTGNQSSLGDNSGQVSPSSSGVGGVGSGNPNGNGNMIRIDSDGNGTGMRSGNTSGITLTPNGTGMNWSKHKLEVISEGNESESSPHIYPSWEEAMEIDQAFGFNSEPTQTQSNPISYSTISDEKLKPVTILCNDKQDNHNQIEHSINRSNTNSVISVQISHTPSPTQMINPVMRWDNGIHGNTTNEVMRRNSGGIEEEMEIDNNNTSSEWGSSFYLTETQHSQQIQPSQRIRQTQESHQAQHDQSGQQEQPIRMIEDGIGKEQGGILIDKEKNDQNQNIQTPQRTPQMSRFPIPDVPPTEQIEIDQTMLQPQPQRPKPKPLDLHLSNGSTFNFDHSIKPSSSSENWRPQTVIGFTRSLSRASNVTDVEQRVQRSSSLTGFQVGSNGHIVEGMERNLGIDEYPGSKEGNGVNVEQGQIRGNIEISNVQQRENSGIINDVTGESLKDPSTRVLLSPTPADILSPKSSSSPSYNLSSSNGRITPAQILSAAREQVLGNMFSINSPNHSLHMVHNKLSHLNQSPTSSNSYNTYNHPSTISTNGYGNSNHNSYHSNSPNPQNHLVYNKINMNSINSSNVHNDLIYDKLENDSIMFNTKLNQNQNQNQNLNQNLKQGQENLMTNHYGNIGLGLASVLLNNPNPNSNPNPNANPTPTPDIITKKDNRRNSYKHIPDWNQVTIDPKLVTPTSSQWSTPSVTRASSPIKGYHISSNHPHSPQNQLPVSGNLIIRQSPSNHNNHNHNQLVQNSHNPPNPTNLQDLQNQQNNQNHHDIHEIPIQSHSLSNESQQQQLQQDQTSRQVSNPNPSYVKFDKQLRNVNSDIPYESHGNQHGNILFQGISSAPPILQEDWKNNNNDNKHTSSQDQSYGMTTFGDNGIIGHNENNVGNVGHLVNFGQFGMTPIHAQTHPPLGQVPMMIPLGTQSYPPIARQELARRVGELGLGE